MMLVVSMIYAASCSTITEFPDENAVDPTLVNANVRISLNTIIDDATRTDAHDGAIKQRIIVEAYRLNETAKPAIREEVLTEKSYGDNVVNVSIPLNTTKYRIAVWADDVQTAAPSDMYYYTAETLRKIRYNGEYTANEEGKDCFSASKDIDLTKYNGEWDATIDIDMELKRPVGKLILISDDVETYITRAESRGETISRAEINSLTAKVFYSGFAPNGFDAYEGILNDATTGLSFNTNFQLINENEAMVAFDYVFADEKGTQYDIAMQIFDSEGKLINEVGSKKTTVVSGETTVLKSDFLTGDYKPGIGVDTNYDGSIDVVLPD